VQRKASETREEIVHQLDMAFEPASKTRLKDRQTATGIKDSLATPVINELVRLGAELRKEVKDPAKVHDALVNSIKKFDGQAPFNPLLFVPGMQVQSVRRSVNSR
jgi:hypothetical protein